MRCEPSHLGARSPRPSFTSMAVSRGHALVLSAAVHSVGLGVAGWASHGQYREAATSVELRTTRASTLTFLSLVPPEPRPVTRPRPARLPEHARHPASQPAVPTAPIPGAGTTEQSQPVASSEPATPTNLTLRVQELAPGVTVAAIPVPPPPPESAPESDSPAPRGVYQAAALLTPAGSACPELPVPSEWGGRPVSVAVAFVVDTSGKVDPSQLRVIQSPGREQTGRRFYPRIYVVGTRAGPAADHLDPADYDSVLTQAVTSHIAGLRFRPALVGGRPVSSTVLVACHRSPGA